ncbi:MAG: SCO family protein [Gammaproteobacteria bacterium]
MSKRIVLYFALAVFALGLGFGGGYWYSHSLGGHSRLPVLGTAPDYTLTNQLGHTVQSKTFAGKVQVVTFLFPYCTDYCPLIAAHLVSLEQALKTAQLADKVQLVAFNVDPAHTGPKIMAAFMRQYGWDPHDTHWQYLTGTPQQVRQVVTGGFHADYEQVPEAVADRQAAVAEKQGLYTPPPEIVNPLASKAKPDYDITHNDSLMLVDGHGRIRRIFPEADRVSDSDLVSAIRRLLSTTSAS